MPIAAQPLVPTDGHELNVIAIGRVSTVHQDAENIEASYRYVEEFISRLYQGPLKLTLLGEQASGMITDRQSIRAAEQMIATGQVDLVIAEDLARIYRNPRFQYDFVQNAVDMHVRVICPGDNLDTADENWEVALGAAALRHGLYIPDTRRRVRRTATHSFHKGGMVLKVRYGYRKLSRQDSESGQFGPKDLRIAKRPECTAVIREMMQRVMRGDTFAAIARWLNSEGIDPGPYVASRSWTAAIVVALLESPILSGTRTFRNTICRPVFRTGRHKSTKNSAPDTDYRPELAHLGSEEHARLRAEIAARRDALRSSRTRPSGRKGIARKRSIWPGQSATCGICGGTLYYAGKHLICKNALGRSPRRCWNRVQVPAELTRQRVMTWLADYLTQSPSLHKAIAKSVRDLLDCGHDGSRRRKGQLVREIADLERKSKNLSQAIEEGGQLHSLIDRLRLVDDQIKAARTESRRFDEVVSQETETRIEDDLPVTLTKLAGTSFEFADFLRRLFSSFTVHPVQALDTPLIRPRGILTFRPDSVLDGSADPATVNDVRVEVDLFDAPVHIRHLARCVAAKQDNPTWSLKKIATELALNLMTVKRALDYARRMAGAGLETPYRELQARPSKASRWQLR